jgi:hypothetical protein
MLAGIPFSAVGVILLAVSLALLLAKFEWWIAGRAGKRVGILVGLCIVLALAVLVAYEFYDWATFCPGADEKQKAFCESLILVLPSPTFLAAFLALIISSCSVLALAFSPSIPNKWLEPQRR